MTENTTAKSGMTLIELLIVLALLAGLATFALTSMGTLSARSRYNVTVERMKRVDVLLRGDGTTLGRFVADMGRLPTNLCELWSSSNNFGAVFYTNEFAGTAVTGALFCGRGGPYLVPSGTNYYDGFGYPFKYTNAPVPYLATTGLIAHADWLKQNLSNSYAAVTQCVLMVQVMALNTDLINSPMWDILKSTNAMPQKYNVGTAYAWGKSVLFNSNVYRCINSCGYTGGLDTDMTYSNWLPVAQHNYPSEAKVLLRVPNVSNERDTQLEEQGITTNNPCIFEGICPGTRTVMAYGYNSGEQNGNVVTTNKWWSGLQSVEIRPGMNFVKLYLTERIE